MTGIFERHSTYHYRLRALAITAFWDNYWRMLGKQLTDGRAYVITCGNDFTVLDFIYARPQETIVCRSLLTLKNYADARVSEYVDFDALVATDRQLGVVMPHSGEHWVFCIEYFDLCGKTVKCWKRAR